MDKVCNNRMCATLGQRLYHISVTLPVAYTQIIVITYNLILKILNGSSAFSGPGIIRNVLLCCYKINHARSPFLYDTEVS